VRSAATLGVVIAGCGRIGFGDASYAAEVIADHPVGYWRLDDAESGIAKDSSPSRLDGTYAGSVASVAGALSDGDTAAEFDGAPTAFVTFVDDPRLEPGSASFTFEVWLRVPAGPWNAYVDLVGKRSNCGSTDSFWNLIGYPSRTLATELRDSTLSKAFDLEISTPDASWHQYVRVLDRAAGTVTTYVDGTVLDVRPSTGLGAVSAAAPMRIGCALDSIGFGLPHALDELAVYDHALAADRVAAHFAAR